MINNLYVEEENVKDDCVFSNSHTVYINYIDPPINTYSINL